MLDDKLPREKTLLDKLDKLGIMKDNEPNLEIIKEKIDGLVRKLSKFKELAEEGDQRDKLRAELVDYLEIYYNYNRDLL